MDDKYIWHDQSVIHQHSFDHAMKYRNYVMIIVRMFVNFGRQF